MYNKVLFMRRWRSWGKKGATHSLSLSLQSFVIAIVLIDSWYEWVRALPVHPPISHLLQVLNMMAEGRRSLSCSQWVTLDEDADGEMQFLSSIICLSPCFSAWGPSTRHTADHLSACPRPLLIKAASCPIKLFTGIMHFVCA